MTNLPMSTLSNAELAAADPDVWIEVDGELIPNYDATLSDFDEGDVVTGLVVRIDKDEVLIDIGYKSEGVIPVNELSIRRSVNPGTRSRSATRSTRWSSRRRTPTGA